MRSFRHFNQQDFKTNILNHHYYIDVLHEVDPNIITQKILIILQDSLQPMAPIKIIQVTNKNQSPLSQEAKTALAERDIANDIYKQSKLIEDLRHYKHLKNTANRIIATEKYKRKVASLQHEDDNMTDKWKKIKKETGQGKITSPQIIIENTQHHTGHSEIANALNRQYVQSIKKTD